MNTIFIHNSFISKNIAEIFFNDYDDTNIYDNDRSVMLSRIDYFDRNEPCKSFLNIF